MIMELTDTHCHIHEAGQGVRDNPTSSLWQRSDAPDPEKMLKEASAEGVTRIICVGTTYDDSILALKFAQKQSNTWASIGIHPHEAKNHLNSDNKLRKFAELASEDKLVAIGECGLDYYYDHSPREEQQRLLRFQLELAVKHNLPLIFHVREAFDDFWPILDDFEGLRGVIHSFTATSQELNQVLSRGFYIGLNGIMTFTKDKNQLETAKMVPLQKLLLETDAPFLTPVPFRGTICQPKHVSVVAKFLADLRGEPLEELAAATTTNAKELFRLI